MQEEHGHVSKQEGREQHGERMKQLELQQHDDDRMMKVGQLVH